MSKELIICPSCGSSDILTQEKKGIHRLTLGGEFFYKKIINTCHICKEEGDFLAETDKNYLIAEKKAQIVFAKDVIEKISDMEITMAMFERVFELPARTLTRWKNGDFSASALALLRIIITYPWMVEVAENKFEKNYARSIVIKAAADQLIKESEPTLNFHSVDNKSLSDDDKLIYGNPIQEFSFNHISTGA